MIILNSGWSHIVLAVFSASTNKSHQEQRETHTFYQRTEQKVIDRNCPQSYPAIRLTMTSSWKLFAGALQRGSQFICTLSCLLLILEFFSLCALSVFCPTIWLSWIPAFSCFPETSFPCLRRLRAVVNQVDSGGNQMLSFSPPVLRFHL